MSVLSVVYVAAIGSCLLAARRRASEQRAWCVIGLAIASYWMGDILWRSAPDGNLVPSVSHAFYALFYVGLAAGVVLLLRARAGGFPLSLVLDGITAGFAITAVATTVVLGPATQNGAIGPVLGNLAYPFADALILGVISAVMVLAGRPHARAWALLTIGIGLLCVADSVWAYQTSTDNYLEGTWLDVLWPAGLVMIGAAARVPHSGDITDRDDGWKSIWLPTAFGIVALGVLVVEGIDQEPVAVFSATISVFSVFGRGAQMFRKRMQTLQALESREELYRSVLRSVPDTMVAVYDHDLRLHFLDGDHLIDGVEKALPRGSRPWDVVPRERAGEVESHFREALAGIFSNYETEHSGRLWAIDIGPYAPDGRRIDGVVAVARDITEARAAEQRIAQQALRDALTGLANRNLFRDRLQQALMRLDRDPGHIAVFFIDLDRFKFVNDSLGHAAGDELLLEVARRVRATLRPSDTLARFGGDEFIVICERLSGAAEGEIIADRILAALAPPGAIAGHEVAINASIGIVMVSGGDCDADEIISNADAAMYAAKDSGRGCYAFFDSSMRTKVAQRLSLESALPGVVERGELWLAYQPQIDLSCGRIASYEALVRWRHPERGVVDPGEFIPIAEESGAILEIGDWVLRQACRDSHSLPEDVVVAVNLSARQLRDPSLVAKVGAALTETRACPSRICLEVTETALLAEPDASAQRLRDLRDLGLKLAIDDFGVGFSSLNQLRRLPPIDILKIDREFVSGLADSARDAAIVTSIITLARSLEMEVIAEGVETPEQAERLVELGCAFGQGFWFGAPRPLDAAGDLVASVV